MLIFSAGSIASCGSSAASIDLKKAEAIIGPEGGELVGTDANGFPGFTLKVPAGALAQSVTVRFEGTLDATPLPRTAEQIGPQVRIMPEGTVLSKPAQLTTPVDPVLREVFDGPASECKVWARDGAAWTRHEAIATTATSVTVELSSFTTAAAGIVVTPRLPTCNTALCGMSGVGAEAPCVSDTGYCITAVKDPGVPLQSFAMVTASVINNKVYYLNIANSTVAAVRYNLDGLSPAVRYAELAGTTGNTLFSLRRAEATNEDTVWSPVKGLGNVKFPKTGLPQRFDTTEVAEAVIVTGSGETDVTRVSSSFTSATVRQFVARNMAGQSNNFATGGVDSAGAALATTQGKFFFRDGTVGNSGTCVGSVSAAANTCLSPDRAVFGGRTAGAIAAQPTQMAAADSASDGRNAVAVYGPTGKSPSLRTHIFPNGVSSMDFGGSDSSLYAVNSAVAEVMIMSPAGGLSTLRLTEAAVGSDAYQAMLPRRIIRIQGKNALLVIVKGDVEGNKRFWRLRQAAP